MGRSEPTKPPEGWPVKVSELDERLRSEGWAAGLDVWEQVGKAYEWYLGGAAGDRDTDIDDAQLWSLKRAVQAQAERGSAVEAWIKRVRDAAGGPDDDAWRVLDDLLDDYRDHADTGTPLDSKVRGPVGPGEQ